jgi:hypothetical protein
VSGTAIEVVLRGIGLLGPGLDGWAEGRALLRDPSGWRGVPTAVPLPARLPPTERRRAGVVVKAAIAVADEACAAAGVDPAQPASVFASSSADPANCHALCEALAAPQRLVSPTRFTNSVHNAASGYWHIAAQSVQASTSLSAFDASFAAGLLEAAVQCHAGARPVLLVACDVPYPEPLHAVRPLADTFALALLLAPAAGAGPRLTLRFTADAPATRCDDAALEALRAAVPAARALPLLQALARGSAATVVVEGPSGRALQIGFVP